MSESAIPNTHLTPSDQLGAPADVEGHLSAVRELAHARDRIRAEIGRVIVGQDQVVDHLLTLLFARGHGLFVGVPGLAKTLLIQTLSQTLGLDFQRIQFTPDLMPSDITGTDVLEVDRETGLREFRFLKGPIFCNLLLADEINRTPPKTQAALLQAMQEGRVTAGGKTWPLAPPFLVFATQNPIEQEGTYPLPEAQLDRFMFMIRVGYPSAEEEVRIVETTTAAPSAPPQPVLSPERILALQDIVRKVPVAESVVRYAVRLARATRPDGPEAPELVKRYVTWGAGPRASQFLVLAGKARALLHGRPTVLEEDIRALAEPVLCHRVVRNYHAEADGVDSPRIVRQLVEMVGRLDA